MTRHGALTAAIGTLCASAMQVCLAGNCTLGKLVEFPITMVDLRPQVTASINGKEVQLLVDSGAFFSVISPASAIELRVPVLPAPFGFYVTGANGSANASITKVKDFKLPPGLTLHNIEFVVAGSQIDHGSVGVLGQNVLHYADIEYDLSRGVIRLMKPKDCGSRAMLAYWAIKTGEAYSEIPIESAGRTASAIAHASINGTDIRVLFDSGAAVSTLTLKAAARVGMRPDSPGIISGGPAWGIGRNMVPSYIAAFASFKIGDEEIRHARLRFADFDLGDRDGAVDMLVGADFFLSHHIYVANGQQKFYFTYNGGPVFDLRHTGDGALVADAPPVPAVQDANAPAAVPGDAADHSRRGTAMAARGDYAHALAELSQACELAPDNPEFFYQRSQIYLRMDNLALALQDLNETLRLSPRHIIALVARSEARLAQDDITGATADLDAADRAAGPQEDLRYEMAALYERADRMDAAVNEYDLWIAVHADDARIPYAMNSRCWARASSGRDLSLALKDCNAALKRARKGSEFYAQIADSRAFVFLRLGEYPKSIADYDAAIAIAPKKATSWYGRGIDKLRQHQTAAGDADLAQAKNLEPRIAEKFARLGVEP